ncbi:MAG TPA: hypothetical protein VFZ40_18175, partial [Pyrinomonadaceae bacterium]
ESNALCWVPDGRGRCGHGFVFQTAVMIRYFCLSVSNNEPSKMAAEFSPGQASAALGYRKNNS